MTTTVSASDPSESRLVAFGRRAVAAYIDSLPPDHPERIAWDLAIADLRDTGWIPYTPDPAYDDRENPTEGDANPMTHPTAFDVCTRRRPLAERYDLPIAVTIRECHRLGLPVMAEPFTVMGRRALVIDLPPRTPRVDFHPTNPTEGDDL